MKRPLRHIMILAFGSILTLVGFSDGYAQSTLFSENFDSYADGTTSDPGRWSSTPPGSENYFEVRNNRFEADNLDGDAIWETDAIDISSCDSVQFSLDAIDGDDLEGSDYFDVYYSTDGGSTFTRIPNWSSLGDANHTLVGDKPDDLDWGGTNSSTGGSVTITESGITGGSFVLRVVMNNNAEIMALDNVLIEGYCVSCPHSISGFSPSTACPDTGVTVTINGSGFTSGSGTSDVQFGGVSTPSGDITVVSDSQIDVIVPDSAVSGVITVVTDGCSVSSSGTFTVDCSTCAELFVNEFSNGESGSREYAEFIVGNSCGGCEADLRGWIVDDNNGDFSGGPNTGEGIAQGHVRFDPDGPWGNIPTGSIIVLYNDGDENLTIQNLPLNDDPYDSNGDSVYVIPISNTDLQECTSVPSSSDDSYSGCTYTQGPTWNPISMSNSQDAMQTRDPDGNYFHGASYGSDAAFTGGPDGLHVHNSGGSDDCFYFGGTNIRDVGNWNQGTATNDVNTTDETPGSANNSSNQTYIDNLKCSPLPIELLSFSGEVLDAGNSIFWETSSEIEHDRFILQKSANGYDFEDLFIVEGTGGPGVGARYSHIDRDPVQPVTYYRLKSFDLDGLTEYSEVLALKREGSLRTGIVHVFREGGTLHVRTHPTRSNATLRLRDLQGRVLDEKIMDAGMVTARFDLSSFAGGVYFVEWIGYAGEREAKKVFVE